MSKSSEVSEILKKIKIVNDDYITKSNLYIENAEKTLNIQYVKKKPPCCICWSCGRAIPESHYEVFHASVKIGMGHHKLLDDMGYPSMCCRRMFLGDAENTRILMALYDENMLNDIH